MNKEQTISIIASPDDGIYYNHETGAYIDLDTKFNVKCIKEMVYDEEEGCFYMLTNKYKEKLGLYLVKFDEQDPDIFTFVLKYENKLDIGNADVSIVRNPVHGYKELLICYKTIYMNTYTV